MLLFLLFFLHICRKRAYVGYAQYMVAVAPGEGVQRYLEALVNLNMYSFFDVFVTYILD